MGYISDRVLSRRTNGSTAGNELELTEFKRQQGSDPPTTTSSYEKLKTYGSWYFVGWDHPRFYARRRKGELLSMTPYHNFEHSGSSSGPYDIYNNNSSPSTHYWCEPSTGYRSFDDWILTEELVSELYAPSSYDQYLQEAAAKIYGEGHDTLTFLAELTDVKHLFVNAGKAFLKGRLPLGWRKMSGAWLSTRYGWRTLLYDLQDLNKAIRNLQCGKVTRYGKRAGDDSSFTSSDAWETEAANGTRSHTWLDEVTVGVRGSVVADVTIPQFQFNPLQTGWELIPFSFVVDWFLSVGKTLAAISFAALNPNYVAAAGYQIQVTRTYSMETVAWESGWTGENYQEGTMSATMTVRTPMRIPYLPRFVLRLNNFKVLDLLALVVQRLK